MLSRKSLLISLMTFSLIHSAVAATASEILRDAVIEVMRQCYEVDHKKGTQLAKCMSDVFFKIPNPQHFKIKVTGDTPGDLTLLIYDPTGYTINCAVSAQKTIVVKKCFSYLGSPLNQYQDLSINPRL